VKVVLRLVMANELAKLGDADGGRRGRHVELRTRNWKRERPFLIPNS
jgi:hypothetical protein